MTEYMAQPIPGSYSGGPIRIMLVWTMILTGAWWFALSHVYVNAGWSDDAWGYFRLPLTGDPRLDEKVFCDPPAAAGSPVPYLKTVRGLPGAVIAVDEDGTVRIDGVAAGRAKPRALDGRPLTPIAPGTIPADRYYLHADHPDSHDSRYAEIGLVPRSRIRARAIPLPDIPWLGLEGPLTGPEDIREGAGAEHGTDTGEARR